MFSIVIPTLGARSFELRRLLDSLCSQTYKDFEIIMIIQDNYEEVENIITDYRQLKITDVRIDKKGLSNARNVAMEYVNGKYVTFSDDDCWYPNTALKDVSEYLRTNDICCFQYFDPILEKYPKKYANNSIDSLSFFQLTRRSSIEIFLNMDRVKKEDIRFDINFGVGGKYPSGEENIFLCDLKRKKYEICYIPQVVVYHVCTSARQIPITNWAIKTKVLNRMYRNKFLSFGIFTIMTFKNRKRIKQYPKAFFIGFGYLLRD